MTSEIDVRRFRTNQSRFLQKDPKMPRRVHHRIGRVERCPGMCRFVFVALFGPHSDRYSGPVGSRRRARDARRPARTASDINLRSFVTLLLRTRL